MKAYFIFNGMVWCAGLCWSLSLVSSYTKASQLDARIPNSNIYANFSFSIRMIVIPSFFWQTPRTKSMRSIVRGCAAFSFCSYIRRESLAFLLYNQLTHFLLDFRCQVYYMFRAVAISIHTHARTQQNISWQHRSQLIEWSVIRLSFRISVNRTYPCTLFTSYF